MSLEKDVLEIAISGKNAAKEMAKCTTDKKNKVLLKIAENLYKNAEQIKKENQKDLIQAEKNNISAAMIDRLTISDKTITSMADGMEEIAQLEDPVGALSASWLRPNGLQVARMRIPLGVIGIIYESRPNVTIDAAGLCLKAGNAVILRGGSEALESNKALGKIIKTALSDYDLPQEAVQVIPTREREAIGYLLEQDEYIDLIIPRGGEGLIRYVATNSRIPVLKHYKGVCHIYVDKDADLKMAEEITHNSKVQRPGVCNALETLLVHQSIAQTFLPQLSLRLKKSQVEIRGCEETCQILTDAQKATEADWTAEYLDLILSVKIVESMDQAIKHIAQFSSDHTDVIITNNYQNARNFVKEVDSSVVLVNASTRFNDGGQLGLGAEMGISTSKLHAFGPMGLQELTTTKFVVFGEGQIRT